MIQIIDPLDTLTGWTSSNGTISLNTNPAYIADNNQASILWVVSKKNSTLTKTISPPIDVSDYTDLTLNCFTFHGGTYSISINNSKKYYLTFSGTLNTISIGIINQTIDQITFTKEDDRADALVISEVLVSRDQYPLDIFTGIKKGIENEISGLNSFIVGSGTGVAGEKQLSIQGAEWLDRYATLTISDGQNSETHQVAERQDDFFTFTSLFDGITLLHSYANATVFLYMPVKWGTTTTEILLPSITLWRIAPEPVYRGSKLGTITDDITDTSVMERQEGQILKYPILVDCESRQVEVLRVMAQAVEQFAGKETLWVNGKKLWLHFEQPGVEVYPSIPADIIPKIQYTLEVEVRQELHPRTLVPLATGQNIEVFIEKDLL